jgi:hypothetical protein
VQNCQKQAALLYNLQRCIYEWEMQQNILRYRRNVVTTQGDPLMKRTRGNLSSTHLTIPRLSAPSWFLLRAQLLTLV